MKDGLIKIACATPLLHVADCEYNTMQIIAQAKEASYNGAKIVVFPELCITGYTCGDLFLQETLLNGAKAALCHILQETIQLSTILIVGLPYAYQNALYNCAAVCYQGKILGMVPKQNLPNYGEFYEMRHFTPGKDAAELKNSFATLYNGKEKMTFPFGAKQIFSCMELPEFTFGVEICEDVWVGDTPSIRMAQMGATLIVNLSCSDEIIGKEDYRRTILQAKSGSLLCAYAYADAGFGESTQDMVFAGHNLIVENGAIVAESQLFSHGILYGVIDVQKLQGERRRSNTFDATFSTENISKVSFTMPLAQTILTKQINPAPFVPNKNTELSKRCERILTLQATGLATRLKHINCKTAVVGLSGGLDSTLALIVMVHAFRICGMNSSGIIAVTMPCFGTTDRTYQNACRLAKAYGATLREIPIQNSVRQHFQDIGHNESIHDVTYENAQARERTQVLMDIANQTSGIVIGTGDLSELALGWATYNGDHMSMYAVNASIPKTLVRYLVAYEASHTETALSSVLQDVLDTPVSPELLPPKEDGSIAQKTEDIVGPYALHDFFLYYILRFGFSPHKIYRLAQSAFAGTYDKTIILKWLKKFYWRFFSQQFKRSCLPDAPKVGSITLSPRGDWRMPSDACISLWQKELDTLS